MSGNVCAHLFKRRNGWWRHRRSWMRWECVRCTFTTRSYDTADRMAGRPVHSLMSVAVKGFNTASKGGAL